MQEEGGKAGVEAGLRFPQRGTERTAGTVGKVITGKAAASVSTTRCIWTVVQSVFEGVKAEAAIFAELVPPKDELEAQRMEGALRVGRSTPSSLESMVLGLDKAP